MLRRGGSKVYFVIDALDESTDHGKTRDSFLDSLRHLPSKAHLLVTSRYIPDVERSFQDLARLEIHAADVDVKTYLEKQLQDHHQLANYVQDHPSLKVTIIDAIVRRTDGM